METNHWTKKEQKEMHHSVIKNIKEHLSLLYNSDFLPKEVAFLAGLPKGLLKAISEDKYIPEYQEALKFSRILTALITRLNILRDPNSLENFETPNEESLDTTTFGIKATDISIVKAKDSHEVILQIHGLKVAI